MKKNTTKPIQADELPLPDEPLQNMKERVRRKTGGRQKGTSNKVSSATKAIIVDLLTDYQRSGLMASDFISLDAKDRFQSAEKMMQYVVPKMQATSVDFGNKETTITIEQKLRDLSVEQQED